MATAAPVRRWLYSRTERISRARQRRKLNIHVQVFSFLRDFLPLNSSQRGEVDIELPSQATLKDLFIALGIDKKIDQDVFAAEVNHTFQVMINNLAVNDYAYLLSDEETVVMFPPMAGG